MTSEAPTPEEEAAEAAAQAFEGLLRISDAASREPNARDWEPEIRQFAADPAALLTVQAVRDYATLGLRQEVTPRSTCRSWASTSPHRLLPR